MKEVGGVIMCVVILMLAVMARYADSSYYACPPVSLCVEPSRCPPENVTFSALEDTQTDVAEKYVCGVISECEGLVCCNDPIGMKEVVPDKSHWCFQETRPNGHIETGFDVYPYPGMEEIHTYEENLKMSICPVSSVCVKAHICPPQYITFSAGLSEDLFTCGSHIGTEGFVCCQIMAVGTLPEPLKRSKRSVFNPSISAHFKPKPAFSINFIAAGFLEPVTGIKVKKEHPYKEITARSNKEEWECGKTLSIASELQKIYAPIGDRKATEGDYPWHVAILSSTYEYLCSGVIIAEKKIVTIAHCFIKYKSPRDLLVRVGDLDLKHDTESNPAFDVRVKHLVIHPDYDAVKLDWDIAVIELKESLRGLKHVRPACLPLPQYSPVINKCKVPGWGQFSRSKEEKNEFSYQLRAASFHIIGNKQCQNTFRKTREMGAFFKLQDSVLCASGYSNADTCRGDGGSGLVCREKDRFILKGLVSYGLGCGYDLPGVYTDVQKCLDFIKNYKNIQRKDSSTHSTSKKDHFDHHPESYPAFEDTDDILYPENTDYIPPKYEEYKPTPEDPYSFESSDEVYYEESHNPPHEDDYDTSYEHYAQNKPTYIDDSQYPEEDIYPPHRPNYGDGSQYKPIYEDEYSIGEPNYGEDTAYEPIFYGDYKPHKPPYEDEHRYSPVNPIYDEYSPHESPYENFPYKADDEYFPDEPSQHIYDDYDPYDRTHVTYPDEDYEKEYLPLEPGYKENPYEDYPQYNDHYDDSFGYPYRSAFMDVRRPRGPFSDTHFGSSYNSPEDKIAFHSRYHLVRGRSSGFKISPKNKESLGNFKRSLKHIY